MDKIIAKPFFGKLPKNSIPLEENFVRMDKSIIWEFNELFWKHYNLWEKTYGEHFESSLPAGISESHRPEFIKESAKRFIKVAKNIKDEKIHVFEQGPGSGTYAKRFLNYIKENETKVYTKLIYLLVDTSEEILKTCNKLLDIHKGHVKCYMLNAFENKTFKFKGKILFARHSNMWSQFPYRLFSNRKSGLVEIYTRAVCDKRFENIVKTMKERGLEYTILKYPHVWKDFYKTVKLESRSIPFNKIEITQNNVIDNLNFINSLVDWDHNGYIEIVDIILQGRLGGIKPLKYDGAVGCKVDANIISTWGKIEKREVSFTKIRKLNTLVRINKIENMSLLQAFEFFPTEGILEKIKKLPQNTHIAITCTSKKGLDYTIDTAIALKTLGFNSYPHIIARYILDENHLKEINTKLITHNIHEIFIAAGNTNEVKGKFSSSLDLLNAFGKVGFPYRELVVTGYPEGHPHISQEKLFKALEEKQRFAKERNIKMRIISQMCFDADTIINWSLFLKEKGIDMPIHVGIAGKCNMIQLMQFGIKCGVGESLKFISAKKSLGGKIASKLALQYNPDTIVNEITSHPLLSKTNIQGFHYYTFNNL